GSALVGGGRTACRAAHHVRARRRGIGMRVKDRGVHRRVTAAAGCERDEDRDQTPHPTVITWSGVTARMENRPDAKGEPSGAEPTPATDPPSAPAAPAAGTPVTAEARPPRKKSDA